MTWPEIAGLLRKHMTQVTSERQGALVGVWHDKESGRLLDGFQAAYERGGTKLALQCEVGDLERIDAKVAAAMTKGLGDVIIHGRYGSIRDTLDVMSLNRVKLEDGAKALVLRAIRAQKGDVAALSKTDGKR
jgi:hypothetical protein